MSDINVKVGLTTAHFDAGLAKLKKDLTGFRRQQQAAFGGMGKHLAGVFTAGAIGAGMKGLLDKAGKLADVSKRFGVGAEGLQRIGNTAEQSGVSLETVATALNKVAVNQQKVRAGDDEMTDSLNTLGISAEEFIGLNPEEAFLRIADAVKSSTDRGAAYAAVVNIMGKSSGELFSTLELGASEIERVGESMGIWKQSTVDALDEVGDELTSTKNKLTAFASEGAVAFIRSVKTMAAGTAGIVENLKGVFSGQFTGNTGISDAMAQIKEIWNPQAEESDDAPKDRSDPSVIDKKDQEKAAKKRLQDEEKASDMDRDTAEARHAHAIEEMETLDAIAALKADHIQNEIDLTDALIKRDYLRAAELNKQNAALESQILKLQKAQALKSPDQLRQEKRDDDRANRRVAQQKRIAAGKAADKARLEKQNVKAEPHWNGGGPQRQREGKVSAEELNVKSPDIFGKKGEWESGLGAPKAETPLDYSGDHQAITGRIGRHAQAMLQRSAQLPNPSNFTGPQKPGGQEGNGAEGILSQILGKLETLTGAIGVAGGKK